MQSLFSSPYLKNKELYNSLLICNGGKIKQIINKTILPNYGVFDENVILIQVK